MTEVLKKEICCNDKYPELCKYIFQSDTGTKINLRKLVYTQLVVGFPEESGTDYLIGLIEYQKKKKCFLDLFVPVPSLMFS